MYDTNSNKNDNDTYTNINDININTDNDNNDTNNNNDNNSTHMKRMDFPSFNKRYNASRPGGIPHRQGRLFNGAAR